MKVKIDLSKYANLKGKDNVKYQWQDEALKALELLSCPVKKMSSVFKCYKLDMTKSRLALVNCQELGKMEVNYFFKLWNIYTGKIK